MFLRTDGEWQHAGGGGASARPTPRALPRPHPRRLLDGLAGIDWAPDLGARVGSLAWWRGAATCAALCCSAWSLAPPPFAPVGRGAATAVPAPGPAAPAAPVAPVSPLSHVLPPVGPMPPAADAPDRSALTLTAAVGEDHGLAGALNRAGVSRSDAAEARRLLAGLIPAEGLPPGTRVALTLGRRPARSLPRPLEALRVRARFDLEASLARKGHRLVPTATPVAVDRTPVRLVGLVGAGLWQSARAAGAPEAAARALVDALGQRLSLARDVSSADRFELVLAHARAATGEERTGEPLYASLSRDGRPLRLVQLDGAWYDADGRATRRGVMGMPVAGRVSSGFGWRVHPILGFLRLHRGTDVAAPWGSPIFAALDGRVGFAGERGGYGNFVRLAHGQGLETGYGHMSRIAVAPGQRVAQGQVIGYVGSTGLSTGPHLHWEVWRNGRAVDPAAIRYDQASDVSGERLRQVRAAIARFAAAEAPR